MFAQIINTLQLSGWQLTSLEGHWISATHESLKRGFIFGYISELPQDFTPFLHSNAGISRWDVIVFCPEGIDSSYLKNTRFADIQFWYWDIQRGNLFPFPPTNDTMVITWLTQLTQGNAQFQDLNSPRSEKHSIPFVTYSLLSINLLVFFLMTLAGGTTDQRVLIAFGAKVNSLIQAGEIWRFLTSMFIHIGFMHLAFNLYALWSLGPFVEVKFGHLRFFVIYILSGLGGAVASFFFSSALSAGASGAIFGLLGALLYFSLKRPLLWKSGFGMNLVIVLLINFGFGLTQPGIDNFAHLGGLLVGTISCVLLSRP